MKILILDDDYGYTKKLALIFPEFHFTSCQDWKSAVDELQQNHFNLMLLDLNLESSTTKLEGLELIPKIKKEYPELPLIVVTNDQKNETIKKAINSGADNFLRKSEMDKMDWDLKFRTTVENHELKVSLGRMESEQYPFVSQSLEMQNLKRNLEVLSSSSELSLLITGETGVGKEVAAKYLHSCSLRRYRPFVPVNISSIPDNLLESALFGHKKGAFTDAKVDRDGFFKRADGGILFLDEIGELSLSIQVKLLRVIETKTVFPIGSDVGIPLDIQIIAATNRDLKKLIEENQFRSDLYYRLKNFEIEIPPLRVRKDDIVAIFSFYLQRAGLSLDHVDPDVISMVQQYSWPGNIRELKNSVVNMLFKKTTLSRKIIDIDCFPSDISHSMRTVGNQSLSQNIDQAMSILELRMIDDALARFQGRKEIAANSIGITAEQMKYRVHKHRRNNRALLSEYPNILKYYNMR